MHTEHIGVSVVMPAYNASKTVARAIGSVLSQSHRKLELILVDDCSTDDTLRIVAALAGADDRVRLYRNEKNSGVAQTRNRGVAEAKYDWIAFLDSDDLWEPEKLERQLTVLAEDPSASLCFTGSAFIDEAGNRSDYQLRVPERVTFSDILKQNVISCSSVLVRRELMLQHPMQGSRDIHEDYATWLRILRQIPNAVGIDEPLLVYQISTGSKSGNKLKAAMMQWRTYRMARIPLPRAVWSFAAYAFLSARKYKKIKSGYSTSDTGKEQAVP